MCLICSVRCFIMTLANRQFQANKITLINNSEQITWLYLHCNTRVLPYARYWDSGPRIFEILFPGDDSVFGCFCPWSAIMLNFGFTISLTMLLNFGRVLILHSYWPLSETLVFFIIKLQSSALMIGLKYLINYSLNEYILNFKCLISRAPQTKCSFKW